jgi:hypothetical protein
MAVYFGPLVVQASSRPGGDTRGNFLPYMPGSDEAAGCSHARMSGPVQVVEYLPEEAPEHQQVERACGGVADEV